MIGQWKSIRGSAMHIDLHESIAAIGEVAARTSSQSGPSPAIALAVEPARSGAMACATARLTCRPTRKFSVTAFVNAANEQTIDIYVDNNPKPVTTFKGVGEQDENLNTSVLNYGNGRVRVIVRVTGKTSRLGSRKVDLFKNVYFGIVGSEDGTDDYSDSLVNLNWPRA